METPAGIAVKSWIADIRRQYLRNQIKAFFANLPKESKMIYGLENNITKLILV